jgi:hypothetical protein
VAERYAEHYANLLWGEDLQDYIRVTAQEWRQDARALLRHAVGAHGADIPDDLMTVIEDYYRAMGEAENRERETKRIHRIKKYQCEADRG